MKDYRAVSESRDSLGFLWAISARVPGEMVIFIRLPDYLMSLAPCFDFASSSQSVNLLDSDPEHGLMSAQSYSRVWNGNFVRETQAGTSSLLHFR